MSDLTDALRIRIDLHKRSGTMDGVLDRLAESAVARIEQLEQAIREVRDTIGPEPPTCGCDGCTEEISAALETCGAALKEPPLTIL